MPYHATRGGWVKQGLRVLGIAFLVVVFAGADLARIVINMLRGSRE